MTQDQKDDLKVQTHLAAGIWPMMLCGWAGGASLYALIGWMVWPYL